MCAHSQEYVYRDIEKVSVAHSWETTASQFSNNVPYVRYTQDGYLGISKISCWDPSSGLEAEASGTSVVQAQTSESNHGRSW